MADRAFRLDLRTALPIAAFGLVVFVIIFVELCGREDLEPFVQATPEPVATSTPFTPGPTSTPGPSPTMGPEEATATQMALTGGRDRDVRRVQDLANIREALDEYKAEHGSYPSTNGNIQTLCAFTDTDAGCALKDVLRPWPEEPLGNPGGNGYWYASEGTSFSLYAQRESEQFEPCPEHPDHLQDFDSVLCTFGP